MEAECGKMMHEKSSFFVNRLLLWRFCFVSQISLSHDEHISSWCRLFAKKMSPVALKLSVLLRRTVNDDGCPEITWNFKVLCPYYEKRQARLLRAFKCVWGEEPQRAQWPSLHGLLLLDVVQFWHFFYFWKDLEVSNVDSLRAVCLRCTVLELSRLHPDCHTGESHISTMKRKCVNILWLSKGALQCQYTNHEWPFATIWEGEAMSRDSPTISVFVILFERFMSSVVGHKMAARFEENSENFRIVWGVVAT